MRQIQVWCGVAVLGAGVWLNADTYPLTVKEMTLEEARVCPGGYGGRGPLLAKPPATLEQPAQAVSANSIYSYIAPRLARPEDESVGMLFQFDEAEGTGKGYDRMIADLNQNGDLTDDPVFKALPREHRTGGGVQFASFGPVSLPESGAVGIWRPQFYVELYVYSPEMVGLSGASGRFFGSFRTVAANYLEATLEWNGVRERFGVVDGNCNFHMGDPASVMKVGGLPQRLYLMPGDAWLRDRDGSGRFERYITDSESEHFSAVTYFGGKPFTITLGPELRTLDLTPCAEPLGTLAVQAEVAELVLVRKQGADQWDAIRPGIVDGKAVLPPGEYHRSTCALARQGENQRRVQIASQSYLSTETIEIRAGETLEWKLGFPLTLELTAQTRGSPSAGSGLGGVLRGMIDRLAGSGAELEMSVTLTGAAGEQYTSFVDTGGNGMLAPPTFRITGADGKVLGSGNFDFG